jgi:hypothetical protein
MYRKVTRKDINKENMVALSYCQCQKVLNLFGEDYKVGYNVGINGWNYDLYSVHGVSIVSGYNVPYQKCTNWELKTKLIALDNKIIETRHTWAEYEENSRKYFREFLEIFS